jgi:hypothetical protein
MHTCKPLNNLWNSQLGIQILNFDIWKGGRHIRLSLSFLFYILFIYPNIDKKLDILHTLLTFCLPILHFEGEFIEYGNIDFFATSKSRETLKFVQDVF